MEEEAPREAPRRRAGSAGWAVPLERVACAVAPSPDDPDLFFSFFKFFLKLSLKVFKKMFSKMFFSLFIL